MIIIELLYEQYVAKLCRIFYIILIFFKICHQFENFSRNERSQYPSNRISPNLRNLIRNLKSVEQRKIKEITKKVVV